MPLVKRSPSSIASSSDLASDTDWHAQVTRLQSGTRDEKWSAARALAAAPQSISALEAALAEPADPQLREAIFTSLAKHNCAASFDAVLHHLRSDDAELRSLALDAMQLMPEQTSLRLPLLLKDDDPDIRVLVCELARHMPPAAAAPALAGLLATEPQINVCAAAIEVLAEIGGVAELPLLAVCAGRVPAEYFLDFSTRTAAEQIRARAGS